MRTVLGNCNNYMAMELRHHLRIKGYTLRMTPILYMRTPTVLLEGDAAAIGHARIWMRERLGERLRSHLDRLGVA